MFCPISKLLAGFVCKYTTVLFVFLLYIAIVDNPPLPSYPSTTFVITPSAIGIDQRTLSNYETGKTNPDSFALIKLADFFGVSTDYLLGRTNNNTLNADDIVKKIDKLQSELTEISNDIKKLYR